MILFACIMSVLVCLLGMALCWYSIKQGEHINKLERRINSQGEYVTRTREGYANLSKSVSSLYHVANIQGETLKRWDEEIDTHHTQLDWIDERFNSLEHITREIYTKSMDLITLMDMISGREHENPMQLHYERFHNCKPPEPPTGTDPNKSDYEMIDDGEKLKIPPGTTHPPMV